MKHITILWLVLVYVSIWYTLFMRARKGFGEDVKAALFLTASWPLLVVALFISALVEGINELMKKKT